MAALGALKVQVSDDAAEAMLPTDQQSVARYADYLARFPSDNGALVVFVDLLCTEGGWALIQEAEAAFAASPLIDRTISLASDSARYVVEQDGVLDLSRFRDVAFDSAEARCTAANEYQPFKQVLVSQDARATALFLVAADNLDATSFSHSLQEIVAPFAPRATQLGGELILTGEAVMSAELSRVVAADSVYIAGIVILMVLLLLLITRSWLAAVASLGLNVFVIAVAFGFMGWVGLELTPATSLVIFLLVPLSSAFVIHAHGYVARREDGGQGPVPREARLAFVMAGVSTALGFACTGLTPAPDVQSLALMGVVGIAAGTLGVFIWVFPLLQLQNRARFTVQFAIPTWFFLRPWVGYLLLGLIGLQTVVGLSALRVDYGPSDYLPLSNPARADFERVGQWFGRMNMPLMVETVNAEDPQPWRRLKPLVDELYRDYPQAFQVSWFYDHMTELAKAVDVPGETEGVYFPQDAETYAQLLLWFDPEDLELYMDEDRERVLLLLQLPFIGSSDYFELKQRVYRYLEERDVNGYFVGRVSSFFETGHRIGGDNLVGLSVGAALVFVLLLWLFRSLPLALIGIFVNAIPVLSALATLSLLDVPVDMGSSLVAAMAFGIVLDDSTHLLVRVQQLVRGGYDPSTAVIRAIRELIAPIMTTTAAVCAGFGVLFAAEMQPFHDFATVILITMTSALISDVLILPTLVRRFLPDPLQSGALVSR